MNKANYDKIVASVDKREGFQYDNKDKIECFIISPIAFIISEREQGKDMIVIDSDREGYSCREVFRNAKR